MEKELIYHIGTPKTGSTSLQTFLSQNRKELLDVGIFYPEYLLAEGKPEIVNGNAYPLNVPEMDCIQFKQGIENLKKYFMTYDKVLISSEDFWAIESKKERLIKLRELGITVKIVVYLRRQDQYLDSLCNQLIKMGLLSFEKGEKRVYELGLFTDYYTELVAIKDVIGKENMAVRVFEKRQFVGGNIYDDFLESIGVTDTSAFIKPKVDSNMSLSNSYRELLNICNSAMNNDYKCLDLIIISSVMYCSDKYLLQKGKEKSDFFSLEEKKEILEKYEEGNRLIAKEFLQRSDGILFYDLSYSSDHEEIKKTEIELENIVRWVTQMAHQLGACINNNKYEIDILKEKLEQEQNRIKELQQLSDALKKGYSLRKIKKLLYKDVRKRN